MKIYYAHCKSIYNTPQELRDIQLLQALGYEVLNPNSPHIQEECNKIKSSINPYYCYSNFTSYKRDEVMKYFTDLVLQCGVLAFRALPDGKIPSGVSQEIDVMRKANRPVIELPVHVGLREMSLEQTRFYLTEVGER